ncbi:MULTISPECIES: hypothetical protein [unclassified Curtobacterium]|uniref:hypothetical protein n=1 Tax=unclassified Curtobacterium TaxID=257496 RepID=UPI001113500A|nr:MULTISPECIES: hypothetical protein [unclassified Curtobacterium]
MASKCRCGGKPSLDAWAVIERIVESGDVRQLRVSGTDASGTSFTTAHLITPVSTYVIHLVHGEQEFGDTEFFERLKDNTGALAVEYGLLDAPSSEDSGDSHESTS